MAGRDLDGFWYCPYCVQATAVRYAERPDDGDHAEEEAEDFYQELLQHHQGHRTESHTLSYTRRGQQGTVAIDRGLWRAALEVLLDNALKFSPEGGAVEVEVEVDDVAVHLRVRDEGIGVPEAELDLLLSPFLRASNASDIEGAGLGLTVLISRVAHVGGSVDVCRRDQGGLSAHVSLPITSFGSP